MVDISTAWLILNNPFTAITVELVGGWIILRYILPRSTAQIFMEIVRRLKEDPEIKPIIEGAKDIMRKLKPYIEALEKIKPEDVDALVKALKSFTGTVDNIEKVEVE